MHHNKTRQLKQEMKEVDCHEKKIIKICPKYHMLLYVETCMMSDACRSQRHKITYKKF